MASSVKMTMDTNGRWKYALPRDNTIIAKFLTDYDDAQLRKDIMDIKPIHEWSCGVVCISKVEKTKFVNKPMNLVGRTYMVNTKAYELPMDTNKIVSDVFDLSLNYKLLGVNPRSATLFVMESDDGNTNITDEIVELIVNVVNRPIKTLYDELNGWWKNA